MIHTRHYTLDQANSMLEALAQMLLQLREARDKLTDQELHEALIGAAPGNGGGPSGRKVGEAFLEVRGLLAQLQTAGIVLRDIDRGLVDFPSMIDGQEVYLCWELGEDRIEHWHGLEAGYEGREPLD